MTVTSDACVPMPLRLPTATHTQDQPGGAKVRSKRLRIVTDAMHSPPVTTTRLIDALEPSNYRTLTSGGTPTRASTSHAMPGRPTGEIDLRWRAEARDNEGYDL